MRFPPRNTTPSEYGVLIVFTFLGVIGLGVVGISIAFRAPEEKQELASVLMRCGWVSLGIGLAIAIAFWLFRRFTS